MSSMSDLFGVPRPAAPTSSESPASPASPAPAAQPAADAPAQSAAVLRFKSCRWRRPPEDGPECCGHRDVLPMAGTTGFDPEAWCPDCQFYKLRRTPKKRDPNDYRY
jgi:hypothetical protein